MNWLRSALDDGTGAVSMRRLIAVIGALQIFAVNLTANIGALIHKQAMVDFAPQQIVAIGIFLAALVATTISENMKKAG